MTANALTTLEPGRHEVVAVAARSLDSARAFADKFGIEAAYGDYAALTKDPKVSKSHIYE